LSNVDKALKHRVNAARVVIRNQIEFFNKLKGQVASEWKADDTRVTFADFALSEKITSELRGSFKDDQFLSEESVPSDETVELNSRYIWILDPIDGTNNYALGMPSCAISLALLKEGLPVYGLIYDGGTDELMEGGKSVGMRLNGRKFEPPTRSFDQKTGMVAVHFPIQEGRSSQLSGLLENYRIRSLGSAALHLAYVALGRLDGSLDERVRVWDIAAAFCLMEAAGLDIRFLDGSPFPVRHFQLEGSVIRYAAGNASFLAKIENWLG
jgi:myo-inositol-1(or 4)-monophosphatase